MIKFEMIGFGTIIMHTNDPNKFVKPDLSGLTENAKDIFRPDSGAFGHEIDLNDETTASDIQVYLSNFGIDPIITSQNKIETRTVPRNLKT